MSYDRELLDDYLFAAVQDPVTFTRINSDIRLRSYQISAARAIVKSVLQQTGLTIVVMFPRQSGKNELQAQLEAYLLALLGSTPAEMVKVSPTWKPQSLNAMYRLERTLKTGSITRRLWKKDSGYIYRIGQARISFLSGEPQAHIVGATASTLLEVDEAQDVGIDKYDKEIAPMAASTNATRVFWGTAWTSQTLLARELRASRLLQDQDGIRRVFHITADEVSKEVHSYGNFVREQVQRLGRFHPMVRTQFFSEEIEADAGMFPNQRQVSMRGEHDPLMQPRPGRIYAFLIDVGGELRSPITGVEESTRQHDATALTIVEVDPSGGVLIGSAGSVYRVVQRHCWTGCSQTALYTSIRLLAVEWKPRRLVVDATGIGAGLASFLQKALPGKVIPFIFTSASKSSLGWDFLSICDTGRFQDHRLLPEDLLQQAFWQQVEHCQMQASATPGKILQWGVPDGTRDIRTHQPVHDDLLISAALCTRLETIRWTATASAGLIQAKDPLENMNLASN